MHFENLQNNSNSKKEISIKTNYPNYENRAVSSHKTNKKPKVRNLNINTFESVASKGENIKIHNYINQNNTAVRNIS